MPARPLDGIRIVDLTRYQQGPYGVMLLSDLGADVVKIEPPGGELGRRLGGGLDGTTGAYFESYNRNKRSIVLDLSHPRSREVVLRLVARADIVVDNFRPGVMDELGLGFAALTAAKPDVIAASASGFGKTGPWAERTSYDVIAQAMSGITMLQGGLGRGRPLALFPGAADQVGGWSLALACLAALAARALHGGPQQVDVSLYGALLSFQGHHLQRYLFGDRQSEEGRTASPTIGLFAGADGRWIAISVVDPTQWRVLCRVLGMDDAVDDPRFRNGWARMENRDELEAVLRDRFATRERDAWLALCVAADIPAAPALDYDELVDEEQARAAGYLVPVEDHPTFGTTTLIGSPIRFAGLETGPRTPAPELAQHSEEILLEIGYSWDDIEELREAGVTEPWSETEDDA